MHQMFDCTIKHLCLWVCGCDMIIIFIGKQSTSVVNNSSFTDIYDTHIPSTFGSLSVWVGGCDVVIIFIGKQSTSVVNNSSFTGMIHTLFMSLLYSACTVDHT